MDQAGSVSLVQLRELYGRGVNLSQWLRDHWGCLDSDERIIELAYDLQAGSYVAALQNAEFAEHKRAYGEAIAAEILHLGQPLSLLEAGVGEATTLTYVKAALPQELPSFGFDLSWSRLNVARNWLARQGMRAELCCASLSQIPAADSTFDVVFTSHALEPNRGREDVLLRELYRVTGRYLVLLEPGYELASDEARAHMERHRYCRGLPDVAKTLGYRVLEHRLFPFSAKSVNPTALTIIEKSSAVTDVPPEWACPVSRTALQHKDNVLYSAVAGLAYPILQGIACLRGENAIVASHLS